MFMRRRAKYKAKNAFMWRNGAFFHIMRLNLSYVYYEAKQNKVICKILTAFDNNDKDERKTEDGKLVAATMLLLLIEQCFQPPISISTSSSVRQFVCTEIF